MIGLKMAGHNKQAFKVWQPQKAADRNHQTPLSPLALMFLQVGAELLAYEQCGEEFNEIVREYSKVKVREVAADAICSAGWSSLITQAPGRLTFWLRVLGLYELKVLEWRR